MGLLLRLRAGETQEGPPAGIWGKHLLRVLGQPGHLVPVRQVEHDG